MTNDESGGKRRKFGARRKRRGTEVVKVVDAFSDPINIDAATRYNKVCDVKRYMVPLLGAWNLGIWYRVTYLET